MQDGKALQAGTSHYLGTSFARAQNIRFQGESGELEFCHTSSWGTSTRMIGGVIMTHGDDDGLRLPPAIAPRQVVVVPMLRDKPEDAEVLAFGEALVKALNRTVALGEPVRAILDTKAQRSAEKRWNWVRRGAPIIVELGPRDVAAGQVSFMRRDDLRDGDKVKTQALARDAFVTQVSDLLASIQQTLFDQAKAMIERELTYLRQHGHTLPERIDVGSMIEVPALLYQLDELLERVDFVSVGSNDLFQFLFAVDRGNARVTDRFDTLSAPILRALRDIARKGKAAGKSVSLCGEMASQPIGALALIALGYRSLSLSATAHGPVKALILDLDAKKAEAMITPLLDAPTGSVSIRKKLIEFAEAEGLSL